MHAKSIELIWVVVKDLKKAIAFYTENLGLNVMQLSAEFGWAELQGKEGGARLGIAQLQPEEELKPGQNAILTFTVDNLEKTMHMLEQKKVHFIGDVQEVPGHVKMQMGRDEDGNLFQVVQMLS